MLGDLFSGWHIWIILLIIVLLFGATRLPALARSIGQSTRIFKKEIRDGQEEDEAAEAANLDPSSADVVEASGRKLLFATMLARPAAVSSPAAQIQTRFPFTDAALR